MGRKARTDPDAGPAPAAAIERLFDGAADPDRAGPDDGDTVVNLTEETEADA